MTDWLKNSVFYQIYPQSFYEVVLGDFYNINSFI